MRRTPSTATLIGRDEPLRSLRAIVDETRGSTQPRVILVAGESGIGKTRLAAEMCAYARTRDFAPVAGACFPQDRAAAYAGLADLLRARLREAPPSLLTDLVGPYASDIAALVPEVARPAEPGPDGSADEARRRAAAIAHVLLGQIPGRRPRLLLLEDLHWCDDASLQALFTLVRQVSGAPLLLLGTYRPHEAEPHLRQWVRLLERAQMSTEVVLDPLPPAAVRDLVLALHESDAASDAVVQRVLELAEGNPFYVEELVHAAELEDLRDPSPTARADHGRSSRPRWRPSRALENAVEQRVATLSPAAAQLLVLAAVVGRRFDFPVLAAVADLDEVALVALIKEHIAAGLVTEESVERFAFRHALVREVIYASVLGQERARFHKRVADVLERLYGASSPSHLDEIAHHAYEARAWDAALRYAHLAGERARALYAPRPAIDQFSRALECADRLLAEAPSPADRRTLDAELADLYLARGAAYELVGELQRARDDYAHAIEHGRGVASNAQEWQATMAIGQLLAGTDYRAAEPHLVRAAQLAEELQDPVRLAGSLNALGNWRVNVEDPRGALPLHERALGIFEQRDDQRGVAATLDLLGMAAYLSADLSAAAAYFERATAMFRVLDDRQRVVLSLAMLGTRSGGVGFGPIWALEPLSDGALQDGLTAVELAQRIDWPAGEAFARLMRAIVLGMVGEYGTALLEGQRALEIAVGIDHRQWMAGAHWVLGSLYLDVLDTSAAIAQLEPALRLAREVNSSLWAQISVGGLVTAYCEARELGRAAAVLGAASIERSVDSLGEWWINYGHLQLAFARREHGLALRLAERAQVRPLRGEALGEWAVPALLRAEALVRLNDLDAAEQALHGAYATSQLQHALPTLWRCQVLFGQVYRAQGRLDESKLAFGSARLHIEAVAASLSAEPATQARFLTQATRRMPRGYWLATRATEAVRQGGLSARERDVALALARGLSNREIADELVLGERTIETHVSNIFNKLGVTSRRDVAAWARTVLDAHL